MLEELFAILFTLKVEFLDVHLILGSIESRSLSDHAPPLTIDIDRSFFYTFGLLRHRSIGFLF
jgi:hypothetical protein